MRLLILILVLAGLIPAASPGPIPANDWAAIRAQAERSRHAFVSLGPGYGAASPHQHWLARFDAGDVHLVSDRRTWNLTLSLLSFGFPGHERILGSPTSASTAGDRLTHHRTPALDEWFVNRPDGLEHGFVLHQRPAAEGGSNPTGDLTFRIAVSGSLRASGSGDLVQLTRDGVAILHYAGLKVWDATGRTLPARMTGLGSQIHLTIDERGAAYPITIDPTLQQAYFKASNSGSGDSFGQAVAISGDTVVVGAPLEASLATGVNGDQLDNTLFQAGAVYVFNRSGGVWTQQAYLKASNTGSGDQFGQAVAISGDTIAVGAWLEDSPNASNPSDNSNLGSGAVYIFTRSGSTWSQQAFLKASNAGTFDGFGFSVSLSGDTLAVGASEEASAATGVNGNQNDNSANRSGAVYVFQRSSGVWIQQAYLKASNTESNDQFGFSVGVSGDLVIVGAPNEASSFPGINGNQFNNNAPSAGAAYIFSRSGGIWTQQAYMKASNPGDFDQFGWAVAISGETAVVGAYNEDSIAIGVNGNSADNSLTDSGAAYVFVRSGGQWQQQAYLKASYSDFVDFFGYSVAISGNYVLVGAPFESSSSAGIDGDQVNNNAPSSGAAYLFSRSGNIWSQVSYVKPSNTDLADFFGWSAAISGNTALLGATGEDSAATSVNGNGFDNNNGGSGAAYAFTFDTGAIRPARIGTYTSGVWAIDLNGNFLNENGPPDRNVLFSLGIVRQKFRLPVTGTGTACWTPRCISTAPG
jgi:hypothetical protein